MRLLSPGFFKFAFKLIVSISLLSLILYFVGINRALGELAGANVFYILAAVALVPFQMLFKSIKWSAIIDMFGQHIRLLPSLAYTFISLAFGLVTPARLGEFVKAKYLADKTKMGYKRAFMTVVIDKSFDVMAIAFMGLIGASFLGSRIPNSSIFIPILVSLLIALCLSFFYFDAILSFLLKLFPEKYRPRLDEMNLNGKLYTKILLYSLIIWAIYTSEAFFILKSLGVNTVPVSGVMGALSLMALSSAIPISLGGIGVREIAAISFLLILGVEAEKSAVFSLIFTFISFGIPAIAGSILYAGLKDAAKSPP